MNKEIMMHDAIRRAKSLKTMSIWAIVLTFTIIGIPVAIILCIVACVKILSGDWVDPELNGSKYLWGLLTLFLTLLLIGGAISSLIFANIALNKLGNYDYQDNSDNE